MSDSAALIDIRNVIKDYEGPLGPIHALKSVNLRVGAGEFVGIRGPSGSGKSTLLNMITGVDRPTGGQVLVNGQDLTELNEDRLARWRGANVGVVFQFFQLLPTLTVQENVILPMDFARKWRPKERMERAQMLLAQVGLEDQAHKLPTRSPAGSSSGRPLPVHWQMILPFWLGTNLPVTWIARLPIAL